MGLFDAAFYTVVTMLVLWTSTFVIFDIFSCGTQFSSEGDATAKCANNPRAQIALAVTDVITDLMVLIFPIPLVGLGVVFFWTVC